YGIKLIQAEKVTITNEAGGTIKATPTDSGARIAIGGTKMGNCSTCVGSATSTGIGLTLHNYGTIDADSRTVYGGHASTHTSKKTRIYNYDGGMIDATTNAAVKFMYAEDFELYNSNGATIQAGTGKYGIHLEGSSTITIDNAGTISAATTDTIECTSCADATITNSGNITAGTTAAIRLDSASGTNTITDSGTISATTSKPITIESATGVTITNEAGGTISSGTDSTNGLIGIEADNAFSPTITNSGTISATNLNGIGINLSQNDESNLGTDATITNSGTINALGTNADGIRIGDGTGVYNDVTITNSGTIAGGDNSIWIDGSDTTGTNIITKGEATYTGEIDMESAAATMTLDCSITKDMDIEIHGKTNMVVTNNLCGNDTYEILDSSKNADADNSETNGYLRIYGEDLDIAQDNAQYRSENVLSKLRGILSPASDDRDLHAFHSTHRRSEYNDSMTGAVVYFNSNSISPELFEIQGLPATSDYFIGYADQRVSFGNNEYRGGENIALGMNKKFTTDQFNYYITPLIGFEDIKITDVETEGNQAVNSSLASQFMGLDAGIGKAITVNEKNSTSFKMHATYGAQRFPGYTASFADGELLVDDSVDQVLGAGIEIRNALGI
ncbi:MAG: hypothetical protein QF535_04845, partial [Anaerolineales bacterium]|nr:hypothetical protein [Anaerolineales bacterium]